MPDVFTTEKRSEVMSKIRGSGNRSTEMRLIALMKSAKITGWRRGYPLEGKPDFVFPKARLAVFVDGDFWHGHPKNFKMPSNNGEFWKRKIDANRRRDRKVGKILESRGWKVMRIWESSLKNIPSRVVARLTRALNHPTHGCRKTLQGRS